MRKHRVTDRMRRITARRRIVVFCWFLYHRIGKTMRYAEVRPMRDFRTPWCKIPVNPSDCSESASFILRAAGAPTPFVKNDEGFTGTMLASLEHISFSQTRRGDLVVFVAPERPQGDHVVVLLEGGRKKVDPLVWSHGRPGIDVMPLSEMKAGFPGRSAVYLKTVPERYTKAEKRKALAA